MKRSSEESQGLVVVELGLKLQQNNNHNRPFDDHDHDDHSSSGPTCNVYKNSNIMSDTSYTSITCNNNSSNSTIYDGANAGAVGESFSSVPCTVLRGGLQPFDVSASSYYFSPANTPFSKSSGVMATAAMGFPFTAAQWKELERQAMIYKYMMASLPVPHDLLYSSFSTTPSSTFAPASYFMGKYGGGLAMRWSGNSKDAEPGRCRRTDGKKWRCSRDVAPNQKYCERHMHRGRPRSRKHVEQQLLQQSQNHSLSDLPINNNKLKSNATKKTRVEDCLNLQSVESCTVQQSKASMFDHAMVSSASPFENSRSLAWSDEQQWHQLVQTNMNSSVFQQQFEGEPLNLNSNAGMGLLERPLIDAWSMGVTEVKDNGGNDNKSSHSSPHVVHGDKEEMCQIHMGLGLIDSWVASTTTPGGPLAEVLRPGSASNAAMSDAGEGDFVTPPATAVSSPSGVLQKTLATFSDSSGSTSPACHSSKANSDMPFHWLN